MTFRVFSSGQGTEWGIFFGIAKTSNIYLFIFFGGGGRGGA